MHVKSLQVFCDVVGHRSFSKAADENEISQSGASQMVHQLEEHLHVKLIDRSKRPFVLTPEGEVYYRGCRKIVQRLHALEEEVRSLHEEVVGRVSVASIYSVGLTHLDRFVQQFLQQNPKANVRLDFQHPSKVYALVESDQVDIGLVSFPKATRTIKANAWREEPMVLVCAPQHPLGGRQAVSLEELDGVGLVAFQKELAIRHEIDRVLAAHRVHVHVAMEFDNIENIKRAIEINAGVGILPLPTVEHELESGMLCALTIDGVELTRPLGIIHRHGKQFGKTARRFMQMLRDSTSPTSTSLPATSSDGQFSDATSGDNGHSSNGSTLKRQVEKPREREIEHAAAELK